jgi:hypothetical protein
MKSLTTKNHFYVLRLCPATGTMSSFVIRLIRVGTASTLMIICGVTEVGFVEFVSDIQVS